MKKIVQVHMLPTDKNSTSLFSQDQLMLVTGNSVDNKGELLLCGTANKFSNVNSIFTAQHLYFTSDEEMITKEELHEILNTKPQAGMVYGIKGKKVVATTNPELWVRCDKPDQWIDIPKISLSFIKEYVEKPVKEVNLEVEEYDTFHKCLRFISTSQSDIEIRLKLNSDGCVIVSPVEEKMYTREEAMRISYESMLYGAITCEDISNTSAFEKWFDKNYPQ